MSKRIFSAFGWSFLAAIAVSVLGPQTSEGEPTSITYIAFFVIPLIVFVSVWRQKGKEPELKVPSYSSTAGSTDKNMATSRNGPMEVLTGPGEFLIAGLNHEGRKEFVLKNRRSIQEIKLKREPRNIHDTNAIACIWDGTCIGYVPAVIAAGLAPEIDAGLAVKAQAHVWSPRDSIVRVYVQLYCESAKDDAKLNALLEEIELEELSKS